MRGAVVLGLAAAAMLGGMAGRPEAEAQVDVEVLTWSAQTGMLTGMMQETLEDLVDANEGVLATNFSERALAEAYAETGVLEAVYSAALEIEPPALVAPAHEELLLGLELMAEAGPLTRRGLMFQDGETIAEAAGLIEEANGHIRTATDLLNAAIE